MLLIDKIAVFDHVLEQHACEAAYLWSQRAFAVKQVTQTPAFIDKQAQRINRHLAGLLAFPEHSWNVALSTAKEGDSGELFQTHPLTFGAIGPDCY